MTLLEFLLRLEGDIRRRLKPIRVTPLQAGVILFFRRNAEARVTDAAAALGVRLPTLRTVVKALVRTRWVTRHRSVKDDRVVCLQFSRRGQVRAQSIEIQVRQVKTALTEYDGAALDLTPQGSCV